MRPLIVVSACGAFVAVLRNHAEIVLAHANRESPKSAALPFPQALIHSADLAMFPSIASIVHGNGL